MRVTQYKKTRRATGGPARPWDLAPETQPEGPDTNARLVALEGLTTADLRIEWRRLHRATPPSRLSRDLLGANGITDEYPVMRHLCNLETVKTYEGTDHIHTLVIGERVTGVAAYK